MSWKRESTLANENSSSVTIVLSDKEEEEAAADGGGVDSAALVRRSKGLKDRGSGCCWPGKIEGLDREWGRGRGDWRGCCGERWWRWLQRTVPPATAVDRALIGTGIPQTLFLSVCDNTKNMINSSPAWTRGCGLKKTLQVPPLSTAKSFAYVSLYFLLLFSLLSKIHNKLEAHLLKFSWYLIWY